MTKLSYFQFVIMFVTRVDLLRKVFRPFGMFIDTIVDSMNTYLICDSPLEKSA